MAQFISFQPSDFFSTLLYTGTGTSTTFTGVGFQGDFWWGKQWEHTRENRLFDSVRGAGYYISSNSTAAQPAQDTTTLSAWTADGFTLGSDGISNVNTGKFVCWNWKAGTTSGIATNGSTTITPSSYSFDQTAGISVLNYTGNITSGAKLAHGLGATPDFVMIKSLGGTKDWGVYNKGMNKNVDPEDYGLELNDPAAQDNSDAYWNDTVPDSVNLTLGNGDKTNYSSGTMVAYCFAEKTGYSKFGTFVGTGSTWGPFIYTGFRPAFVMMKCATRSGTDDWRLFDDKRLGYNVDNNSLSPNTTAAERTTDEIDLCSNGFKLRASATDVNANNDGLIYAAFAEFPLVSSNSIPGTAR